MSIQLWRSTNGFSKNGTNYDFLHCDSVTVTKNARKHLTRGANSKNKVGLVYTENTKQADTIAFVVLDLPKSIRNILNEAYKNEERLDVYCVDDATGEAFDGQDCIITHFVMQEQLVEGEETYNITLTFETFNLEPKGGND